MKIHTNTTEYEFSHGRKPRGRGSWFFEVSQVPGVVGIEMQAQGTMSEARAEVVRRFTRGTEVREVFVKVMP